RPGPAAPRHDGSARSDRHRVRLQRDDDAGLHRRARALLETVHLARDRAWRRSAGGRGAVPDLRGEDGLAILWDWGRAPSPYARDRARRTRRPAVAGLVAGQVPALRDLEVSDSGRAREHVL